MSKKHSPPAAGDERQGVAERTMEAAAAVRRRNALAAFLHGKEMTVADLARAIGLSNGNLLYNFLHERSDSLSLGVVERILDRYPEVTFEELLGRRPRVVPRPPNRFLDPYVMIVGQVASGVAIPRDTSSPTHWKRLTLPPGMAHPGPGAFAVVVKVPGAETAYPQGSILVCRAPRSDEQVQPGTRVVVRRRMADGVELSVRQVTAFGGEAWLTSLSTHPEQQLTLRLPVTPEGKTAIRAHGFRIEGVVVGAWVPQGILPA